ncbi:MAG TPA: hypothetical protein GXX19_00075 [Syntrophomonadaceae bacterium]|nr:hypothetical protein [Syntrophomonadaceae bacterium]
MNDETSGKAGRFTLEKEDKAGYKFPSAATRQRQRFPYCLKVEFALTVALLVSFRGKC